MRGILQDFNAETVQSHGPWMARVMAFHTHARSVVPIQ
jgi:hypothetical protein